MGINNSCPNINCCDAKYLITEKIYFPGKITFHLYR